MMGGDIFTTQLNEDQDVINSFQKLGLKGPMNRLNDSCPSGLLIQEPMCDVSIRELYHGNQGAIADSDFVMCFVFFSKSRKNYDRFLSTGHSARTHHRMKFIDKSDNFTAAHDAIIT